MAASNARQEYIKDRGRLPGPVKPRQTSLPGCMVAHRDEYDEYLGKANLLDFSKLVNKGLPSLDHGLLSALVDRWNPKTNTFHFPFGEMTPTLQDVAMILALPINDKAVIGDIRPDSMNIEELLGVAHPTKVKGKEVVRVSHVNQQWLINNFNSLPANASPATIQRYARAYALSILGGVIFSNKTSGTVHFDLLPLLADWDTAGQYSWGSALLAFLYRELRMTSNKVGSKRAGIGGCMSFLQLWFWMRVPLGRPKMSHVSRPGEVEESIGNRSKISIWLDLDDLNPPNKTYEEYTLEIETVAFGAVCWLPHGDTRDDREPELCFRDKDVWRAKTYLNYFWIVEPHNVHRVKKQFGDEEFEREIDDYKILHALGRSVKDWSNSRRKGPEMWNRRIQQVPEKKNGDQSSVLKYKEYLKWLQETSLVRFSYYLHGLKKIKDGSTEKGIDEYCEHVVKGEINYPYKQFHSSIVYLMNKLTKGADEYLKVVCPLKEDCLCHGKFEEVVGNMKELMNRCGFYAMPQDASQGEGSNKDNGHSDEDNEDSDDEDGDSEHDALTEDKSTKSDSEEIYEKGTSPLEHDSLLELEARKTKRQRTCQASKSSEGTDEETSPLEHDNLVEDNARKVMRHRYNTRVRSTMNSDQGKKKQINYLTWTDRMDDALLEVLVEHHNNGGHVQNGWKPQVFTAAIRNIRKKCSMEVTKHDILSRCNTFGKHYEIISKILSQSGFEWDGKNNRLSIDSDDVWAKYIENNKDASSYKTKVIKKWDSISLIYSKGHATGEGARTAAENAQEIAAEYAAENGTEGNPPAGQEVHRGTEKPLENDTRVGMRGGIDSSFQPSMNSNEPVQVPQPAPPAEILMVLKQIPDLAREDLLRAYRMLTRDDRQFTCLVALEMDMRKDWLLMEIGTKHA